MKLHALCCSLVLFSIGPLAAQSQENNQENVAPAPGIHMIAENTQAVDYRKGSTSGVDFKGTDLIPELAGEAKIISKRQLTDVHVEVEHLRPAKSLDLAYLTYVLWSISPQGRPKNIGELIEKDGKAALHTTTDMQAFALIITAEPDFAVAAPSEMVVAQNVIREDTKGRVEPIAVRYQAFPRSVYVSQVTPIQTSVYGEDPKAPLDLLQARNAVRIARDAQAEQYAPQVLQHAQQLLDQAEDYYRRKQGNKPISTVAREAVQTAEEARVNSIRAEEQARLDRERRENEQRAAQARADAQQAEQQAQQAHGQAEQARRQAQESQQQAQAEADRRRQIEQQQQAAAQAAQQAQQQAEQAQQQAQDAQQQAQLEAQQRAAAEQQQQQAAQQADEARQQASQAQQRAQQMETQQAQARQQLLAQLNQVLETRDSARGLIVSMPDVLFDTGSANLKATARERLAKVAGILIAYPDIRVEVNGYTDSTGTLEFNQQLSEQRAESVQSYLVQQGVPSSSIGIRGWGQENPIASNDTAAGRQQNRRVELVVSGQSIGASSRLPQ